PPRNACSSGCARCSPHTRPAKACCSTRAPGGSRPARTGVGPLAPRPGRHPAMVGDRNLFPYTVVCMRPPGESQRSTASPLERSPFISLLFALILSACQAPPAVVPCAPRTGDATGTPTAGAPAEPRRLVIENSELIDLHSEQTGRDY